MAAATIPAVNTPPNTPSVPMIGRTIMEDMEIDGQLVEKGSSASMVIALLHRNPEIWTDPDDFKPERFMTGAEG